jgi:hypothetical protein
VRPSLDRVLKTWTAERLSELSDARPCSPPNLVTFIMLWVLPFRHWCSHAGGHQSLARALAPTGPSPSCTLIKPQTISTHSSMCSTATRNAIVPTMRTYFPQRLEGRSTRMCFPREHVHLGWSSYAAMCLSRIPTLIPNHFIAIASKSAARKAFERQAAEDWRPFLSLRASELRTGGRLVVVLPGIHEDGSTGFEPLFGHAK